MRRGEVWWAELPTPAGRRPVLLLSRNEAYSVRRLLTVAPLTTRIRNIPVEVRLDEGDGLPRECVVNLDSLVTIPRSRLTRPLTSLRPQKMHEVDEAIRFALAI